MREGTNGQRYKVYPIDIDALLDDLKAIAPDAVLTPFIVENGERVNVYPLTDRGGMGCVCINMGNQQETISITPDSSLMPKSYVTDMLSGQPVTNSIVLSPNGTRLLYFSSVSREASDIEERICLAEDAYERWQQMGAEVGFLRHNYANMRSGFYRQKRDALARAMLNSLALKCHCEDVEFGYRILVEVYGADGLPVSNAKVTMRITPGSYHHLPLSWNGKAYECTLTSETVPEIYDASTQTYSPLHGSARLILQAETDNAQGGCLYTIRL